MPPGLQVNVGGIAFLAPYLFRFDHLLREFRVMALEPRELDALCPEPDGSFSVTAAIDQPCTQLVLLQSRPLLFLQDDASRSASASSAQASFASSAFTQRIMSTGRPGSGMLLSSQATPFARRNPQASSASSKRSNRSRSIT